MKKKILVTTGTRAEYGILRPLLRKILDSKKLELFLVVTGTHLSKKYGLTINEIRKDGFKIHATIKMIPQGDDNYFMAKELGKGIIEFAKIFKKLQPDINVILGDRDEMLASALAASHMNIPNAHIHGGDISGSIDEYNRHAITKISNIHFAATKNSKNRIIKMGENPKFVFLTGSPSIDELSNNMITSKKELEKKYHIKLDKKTILMIQHPVTTQLSLSRKQICNTLNAIARIGNQTIILAPNSDSGNRVIFEQLNRFIHKYNFVKMYRSLPRKDYLGLLKNCGVLVGNSSSGIIEAGYFRTPVVNIGIRQKNREKSKNVQDIINQTPKSIKNAILSVVRKSSNKKISLLYGKGKASEKIVRILENMIPRNDLIQKQLFY